MRRTKVISWCFEPSQPLRLVSSLVGALSLVNQREPLRIISGLKETFIKRHIVEKDQEGRNKTGKKQSEKAESCRGNSWNEIQLRGP